MPFCADWRRPGINLQHHTARAMTKCMVNGHLAVMGPRGVKAVMRMAAKVVGCRRHGAQEIARHGLTSTRRCQLRVLACTPRYSLLVIVRRF